MFKYNSYRLFTEEADVSTLKNKINLITCTLHEQQIAEQFTQ